MIQCGLPGHKTWQDSEKKVKSVNAMPTEHKMSMKTFKNLPDPAEICAQDAVQMSASIFLHESRFHIVPHVGNASD